MAKQDRVRASMFRHYQRGIAHGISAVWRDRHWKLTLLTLTGSGLLIQLLVLFWLVAFGTQSALSARAPVRLEFGETAIEQDIAAFRAAVAALPAVQEAAYIPREKTYEQMRLSDPDLLRTIEDFGLGNPFPDAIRITPRSFSAYQELRVLLNEPRWQSLIDPAALSQIAQVEQMAAQLQGGISAGGALSTLFLELTIGILLCTVVTVVALRFRQRGPEITAQYLLGAPALGVAIPLLVEGIVLLLIATLLSGIITVGLLAAAPSAAPWLGIGAVLPSLEHQLFALVPVLGPPLLISELVAIVFLALIAAILALTGKQQVRPALF